MSIYSLNHWIKTGFLFSIIIAQSFLFANEYEEKLIAHVQQSIDRAERGVSRLNRGILGIEGMSSPKVRHLLNNLCSLPQTAYLEIGTWLGSTWISALYQNHPTMSFALAIDNWSQFGGTKDRFHSNCKNFLKNYDYKFIEADCFNLNIPSLFTTPINIYFYDGGHDTSDHQQAFTYYNSVFNDVFIAIVDDWNWPQVREGTYLAFEQLHYEILFEKALPARFNQDKENWWNGLYIAVIRKPAS